MNPDLPFTTAKNAIDNCVGYLNDARVASSEQEFDDALDGAQDYAQQALNALEDAAFCVNDISSDPRGVRQPELVRDVIDSEAAAAHQSLEQLVAGFIGSSNIYIDSVQIDAIASLMDAYAHRIADEKAFRDEQPEPVA